MSEGITILKGEGKKPTPMWYVLLVLMIAVGLQSLEKYGFWHVCRHIQGVKFHSSVRLSVSRPTCIFMHLCLRRFVLSQRYFHLFKSQTVLTSSNPYRLLCVLPARLISLARSSGHLCSCFSVVRCVYLHRRDVTFGIPVRSLDLFHHLFIARSYTTRVFYTIENFFSYGFPSCVHVESPLEISEMAFVRVCSFRIRKQIELSQERDNASQLQFTILVSSCRTVKKSLRDKIQSLSSRLSRDEGTHASEENLRHPPNTLRVSCV